tara:strand:- start:1089 stop:4190 length:3102 start_codon:yes stop_codon:yes gene_type:complete
MFPLPRYLITVFSALLIGFTIMLALVTFRFYQGPISVGFLAPYVQEAVKLNPKLKLFVTFDDCVLTWRGINKGLSINILGAKITNENDDEFASFQEVALKLDIRSLFEGEFLVNSVEIIGPLVNFTRKDINNFNFGIGQASQKNIFLNSLNFLFSHTTSDYFESKIQNIIISDAVINYEDYVRKIFWKSNNANILIQIDNLGANTSFSADVAMDKKIIPLGFFSRYDFYNKNNKIEVKFSNLDPEKLLNFSPYFNDLKRINIPLSGNINFQMNSKNKISNIYFNIFSNEGSLDLKPFLLTPLSLTSIKVEGEVNQKERIIVFKELDLSSGTANFSGTAEFPADNDGSLNLRGKINDWSHEDLRRLWPENILPPVRKWYVTSVMNGVITDGTVNLSLSAEEIKNKSINPESIDIKVSVKEVDLKYLKNLPKLSGASGEISITPSTFQAELQSGKIKSIPITEGYLQMTKDNFNVWNSELNFQGVGDSYTILEILNHNPLNIVDKFGVKPYQVSGISMSKVKLEFPVRTDLNLNMIDFSISSRLEKFSVRNIYNNLNLSDAEMVLQASKKNLEVFGMGKLNNVNANILWKQDLNNVEQASVNVSGIVNSKELDMWGYDTSDFLNGNLFFDIEAQLNNNSINKANLYLDFIDSSVNIPILYLNKRKGDFGKLTFKLNNALEDKLKLENINIDTESFFANGMLEVDRNNNITRGDFSKIQFSGNDFSLSVRPRKPNGYIVAINGKKVNLEPIIDSFFDSSDYNLPALKISAQVKEIRLGSSRVLNDAIGELFYDSEKINSLNAKGLINAQYPFKFTMSTSDSGERELTLVSKDAGGLAKTTGLFDDAEGGQLNIKAKIDNADLSPQVEGRMYIENIRLINVPTLARILTLASLTGIINILNGEGVLIVRGDVPFKYDGNNLSINNARAFGPSLGINIDGQIDNLNNKISVTGTLVPAYTINSVLGQIPLVGRLLIGKKGSGIFAVSFGVNGDKNDPLVTINPLLSLSPGFLREFFSVFKTDPNPPKVDETEVQGVPN